MGESRDSSGIIQPLTMVYARSYIGGFANGLLETCNTPCVLQWDSVSKVDVAACIVHTPRTAGHVWHMRVASASKKGHFCHLAEDVES